mmetsp:Transcript_75111/g.208906  ORF Transcript_75111/g.208906 Transcript_75111/m.208906 type:complete len:269 (+) Transcript_75111:60-866(+)
MGWHASFLREGLRPDICRRCVGAGRRSPQKRRQLLSPSPAKVPVATAFGLRGRRVSGCRLRAPVFRGCGRRWHLCRQRRDYGLQLELRLAHFPRFNDREQGAGESTRCGIARSRCGSARARERPWAPLHRALHLHRTLRRRVDLAMGRNVRRLGKVPGLRGCALPSLDGHVGLNAQSYRQSRCASRPAPRHLCSRVSVRPGCCARRGGMARVAIDRGEAIPLPRAPPFGLDGGFRPHRVFGLGALWCWHRRNDNTHEFGAPRPRVPPR